MLVIGETGSGKTYFIKLLLNYAKNHNGRPFDLSEVSKMLQDTLKLEVESNGKVTQQNVPQGFSSRYSL